MERTSNSDIEILIKLYHTAEFDGALKIAFYLKNWLILIPSVAGFLGYPQPGGGTHPPIPREGVLGKVLGDWADLALR